jgi:WD40 repeat protein
VAWIVAAAIAPDGQTAAVSQYRRKGGDFNNYPAGLRIFNVADGSIKLDFLATLYPKEKNPPYQYQFEYHEFVAEGLVALAFSPDGKLLAAGQGGEGGAGKIHILETETGKVLRTVHGHKYGVTDLVFTSDGKYLFSAGRDTRFRITRVEDGGEIAQIGKERGGQFFDWLAAIALSPDETRLAAADIAGFVQVWDLTAG